MYFRFLEFRTFQGVRCISWHNPYLLSMHRLRQKIIHNVIGRKQSIKLNFFATFTYRDKKLVDRHPSADLRRAINRLKNRRSPIYQFFKKDFAYCTRAELSPPPRQRWHHHVLIQTEQRNVLRTHYVSVPKRVKKVKIQGICRALKMKLQACWKLGWVQVKFMNNSKQALSYLSKYISKSRKGKNYKKVEAKDIEISETKYMYRGRLWNCSRNFKPVPPGLCYKYNKSLHQFEPDTYELLYNHSKNPEEKGSFVEAKLFQVPNYSQMAKLLREYQIDNEIIAKNVKDLIDRKLNGNGDYYEVLPKEILRHIPDSIPRIKKEISRIEVPNYNPKNEFYVFDQDIDEINRRDNECYHRHKEVEWEEKQVAYIDYVRQKKLDPSLTFSYRI